MKTRTTVMSAAALAAAMTLFMAVKPSQAGTCPTDLGGSGTRNFTVAPGACIAYGNGNVNGNNDAVNQLGYVTLDKSDDGGTGALPGILTFSPPTSGLSGTWSFTPNALYKSYVLALKSGEGQFTPTWAAFSLGGASGNWSITGAPQNLSHANLYAQVVPIPAALPLMLGALAGLGLIARRKRDA